MLTDGQIRYLLYTVRSETKRWGGSEPGLAHLAFVLARRWKVDFLGVFGEAGQDYVERLLRDGLYAGGEQDVLEVLESPAADHRATLTLLRKRLTKVRRPPRKTAKATTADDDSSAKDASPAPEGSEPEAPADSPRYMPEPGSDWHRPFRFLTWVQPRTDVVDRDAEVTEVVAHLSRRLPPPVVIAGAPGSGRSALLGAIAARLGSGDKPRTMHCLSPRSPASAVEITAAFAAAPPDAVIVIDDLDLLAALGAHLLQEDVLSGLLTGALQTEAGVIVTVAADQLETLAQWVSPFTNLAVTISLPPMPVASISTIVTQQKAEFERVHGVKAGAAILTAVVAEPSRDDRLAHPGLALSRLDWAMARAALAGDATATPAHLVPVGAPGAEERDPVADLATALAQRIKGQDHAIEAVTRRLALTRMSLDLRPERPNGVFLFVGPTGVGKTELAREIARVEYGDAERMIRLDMSEYVGEWAVTRLTGPMPGYIGFTEPDNWLTTRVAATPRCLLLLDEIEKANPTVWNTFLQVFDAGRLTDARGVTADFRDVTVIMTSNLGAREATSEPVGFADLTDPGERSRERLLGVLQDFMAPELLNRMDEIVVFKTLDPAAILEIARAEVMRVLERLARDGWEIEVDAEQLASWLATTGYDPAFGARHLQRNIERELLMKLALAPTRKLTATVTDAQLSIIPGKTS